ncbi:hypothetical protein HZB90_02270, partial [archaeon]|nr:hypothetical protein [archaeon]
MARRTEHLAAIGYHQSLGKLETAPVARAHGLRNLLFPVENAFEKITEPHVEHPDRELIYKFFIIMGYSRVIFLKARHLLKNKAKRFLNYSWVVTMRKVYKVLKINYLFDMGGNNNSQKMGALSWSDKSTIESLLKGVERKKRKKLVLELYYAGVSNDDEDIKLGTVDVLKEVAASIPDSAVDLYERTISSVSGMRDVFIDDLLVDLVEIVGEQALLVYSKLFPDGSATGRFKNAEERVASRNRRQIILSILKHEGPFDQEKKKTEDGPSQTYFFAGRPAELLKNYHEKLSGSDPAHRRRACKWLSALAATLKGDTHFIVDQEFLLLRDYLHSKYAFIVSGGQTALKPKDVLGEEVELLRKLPPADFPKLRAIIKLGEAKDLDELVECASIDIPDYLLLRRLGAGAIKKAYLGISLHVDAERVILILEPSSAGFRHYRNVYPDIGEGEVWQRICDAEFSAVRLNDIPDKRFLSQISPPKLSRQGSRYFYFFEMTPKYARTLQEV